MLCSFIMIEILFVVVQSRSKGHWFLGFYLYQRKSDVTFFYSFPLFIYTPSFAFFPLPFFSLLFFCILYFFLKFNKVFWGKRIFPLYISCSLEIMLYVHLYMCIFVRGGECYVHALVAEYLFLKQCLLICLLSITQCA